MERRLTLPTLITPPKPVRIQLSRQRGFNLQAASLAINGLPAIKVDRSTPWGNPFKPGSTCAYTGGRPVQDNRHAFVLFKAVAPLDIKRVEAARKVLAGHNLACWCGLGDDCHADVWLDIANPPNEKVELLARALALSEEERDRLLQRRYDWRESEWQDHCGVVECPECDGDIPSSDRLNPEDEALRQFILEGG